VSNSDDLMRLFRVGIRVWLLPAVVSAWAVASLSGAQGVATQSPASAEPGPVVGVVVQGLSEVPVAEATVRLTGRAGTNFFKATLATDKGEFVFHDVPPGSYTLEASRTGYSFGVYGSRRPGSGTALVVGSGASVRDIRVPLWPMSAIEGTVRDEAGEPVVGVRVEASTTLGIGGHRVPSSGRSAQTDDRGRYRISGLTAAEFAVCVRLVPVTPPSPDAVKSPLIAAEFMSRGNLRHEPGSSDRIDVRGLGVVAGTAPTPPDGSGAWYPSACFPSGATEAGPVRVASGQTRRNVDIDLRPVFTRRVSGRLTSADGRAVAGLAVRLNRVTSRGDVEALDSAIAFMSVSGNFVFPVVPPGQYQLRAFDVAPKDDTFGVSGSSTDANRMITVSNDLAAGPGSRWARQAIAVADDDIEDLELSLQPGLAIEGQLVFEGQAPPPALQQRATSLLSIVTPTGGPAGLPANMTALIDPASSTFRTVGLEPGRYLIQPMPSFPAPWTLKSVTLKGREMLDTPIDLTTEAVSDVVLVFTDRAPVLTATVSDRSSPQDTSATVFVFPADPRAWIDFGRSSPRYKTARVNEQGVATIRGLPPGDYLVTAVPDEFSDQWMVRERLVLLAKGASPVSVQLGDSKAISVRTNREYR
jgi:hypothetical protein